jgi:hypothetical protein
VTFSLNQLDFSSIAAVRKANVSIMAKQLSCVPPADVPRI